MPYIGQSPASKLLTASDITDGVISTAKLADSSVSTAKLADDSVGNTKLDLSADFAFTGTVSGAGSLNLLQTTTIANGATSVIFSDLNVYAVYKVEFIRLRHSSSGGAKFYYQAGTISRNSRL